jgi:hypothetical protein
MALARGTDVEYIGENASGGMSLGSAITEKISFFGVTPIVQRAGTGTAASPQIALTTALASVTVTGAYGFALSSGFSALLAQVEEIRATLVAFGLMSGT